MAKPVSNGHLDEKADELLWHWMMTEDQHTVDQFGIGIVGIGALFFAYSTVKAPDLRLLIAVIGLAGSLTLLNHMWGAKMESYHIRDELKSRNPVFFEQFHRIKEWRNEGWARLYVSSSRLMIYVMGGVSWIWTVIIAYRSVVAVGPTSAEELRDTLVVLEVLSLLVAFVMAFALVSGKRRDERFYKLQTLKESVKTGPAAPTGQ